MKNGKRFVIYRRELPSRIAPANFPGLLIFLLNLGAFFVGLFNFIGIWDFVPDVPAAIIAAISIGFFVYSIIFLTDYSERL